jgi:uncharacterized protein YbaP (TraB family)
MNQFVFRAVSVFFVSIVTLTSPVCSPGEAETVSPPQKIFLWKVQSPSNRVYLLGSVHFLKPEDYPLPSAMQAAFDDAEGLVFEVNFNLAESVETQRFLLQQAQPEAGKTLQTLLDAQTYSLAEEKAAELGLPIALFENFEPWFLTLSLVPLKLQTLGFNPEYGVDQYFFNQAVEQGKGISALETIEEQLTLLNHLSDENQQAFLLQTLQELDTLQTSLHALVETWSTGDVEGLERLILEGFEPYPALQEDLITSRNRTWVGTIDNLLKQREDYLVVVGAAHLVGEQGVIQLLENQGYPVIQAEQSPE